MSFPVPSNEHERLEVLRHLDLIDSPQDSAFDDLCQTAARTFGAPIALITLLDTHRQWFKARVGLDLCETARDASFCNYVVAEDTVLIVPTQNRIRDFPITPSLSGRLIFASTQALRFITVKASAWERSASSISAPVRRRRLM